ncbi:MAG: hypothetical protein VX434_02230 [Pseudomonadota bacterium]|nr:hypothetical protein [Pseudomonadota bacterium]|tara:strand:- start:249 stop:836 length:588 start_codon:yes stop_codon:yes gene_type:complete
MRFIRKCCVVLLLPAFLLACEAIEKTKIFPELRYTHLPVISLAVSKIDVKTKYQSAFKKPNVETEFPILPATVVSNWFKDRLSAVGGSAVIRATVTDASVIEVPLKRSGGIRGVFTKDQSERYDAVLSAKIEIFDSEGVLRGTVSSKAKRSQTVSEDVTLAEREIIWFRMLEFMMNDLNRSLESQIRKYFQKWLR